MMEAGRTVGVGFAKCARSAPSRHFAMKSLMGENCAVMGWMRRARARSWSQSQPTRSRRGITPPKNTGIRAGFSPQSGKTQPRSERVSPVAGAATSAARPFSRSSLRRASPERRPTTIKIIARLQHDMPPAQNRGLFCVRRSQGKFPAAKKRLAFDQLIPLRLLPSANRLRFRAA